MSDTPRNFLSTLSLGLVALVGCGTDRTPQVSDAAATPADARSLDASIDAATQGDAGAVCRNPADGATQPDGAPMPNLTVLSERMRTRMQFAFQNFSPNSCDVREERCVAAPGCRRLLRFDLVVANSGEGDMYLGAPNPANRQPPVFEHSACHNHYHLLGFAEFDLLDARGRAAGHGHKQSFCLMDLERRPGAADIPRASRYACNNQGIHAGWADIYDRGLDCQHIDITDVAPGRYRLRARINTQCHIPESDYTDNTGEIEIDIPPANGQTCAPANLTGACAAGSQGLDRDCGWTNTGARSCTPGRPVTVGCDPACAPSLGACEGDPILRVCPGNAPCTVDRALASNDDSAACRPATGSNVCARLTFPCPEGGRYTVLTGPYQPGQSYRCDVAVAP